MAAGRSMKLGGGARFAAGKRALEKKGMSGKRAGAIMASTGRKKYGAKRMSSMASAGRKRAARRRAR